MPRQFVSQRIEKRENERKSCGYLADNDSHNVGKCSKPILKSKNYQTIFFKIISICPMAVNISEKHS